MGGGGLSGLSAERFSPTLPYSFLPLFSSQTRVLQVNRDALQHSVIAASDRGQYCEEMAKQNVSDD